VNKDELLHFLLQQSADQTFEWIQNAWRDTQLVPKDFNWLGLAEVAAFQARRGNEFSTRLPDLVWAKIAIAIYEYLIEKTGRAHKQSFELSIMSLRAHCIIALGSVPDDPILDVNRIVQWFFQNVEMTLDEAREKAANWKERPLEEIRELRYIKNRLSIIKPLFLKESLECNQELSDWLELQEDLP